MRVSSLRRSHRTLNSEIVSGWRRALPCGPAAAAGEAADPRQALPAAGAPRCSQRRISSAARSAPPPSGCSLCCARDAGPGPALAAALTVASSAARRAANSAPRITPSAARRAAKSALTAASAASRSASSSRSSAAVAPEGVTLTTLCRFSMFCDSPSSDFSAESRTRFGTAAAGEAWFSFGCSHARLVSFDGLPSSWVAASAARKGLLCAVSFPTGRRAPRCRMGLSFFAGERGTGDPGESMGLAGRERDRHTRVQNGRGGRHRAAGSQIGSSRAGRSLLVGARDALNK